MGSGLLASRGPGMTAAQRQGDARIRTHYTRSMKRFPIAAAFALSLAPAFAQTPPSVPSLGGAPAPSLAPQAATTLSLSAVFAGEQKPIRSGLTWRVYEDRSDVTQLAPIAKSSAASPSIPLKPGSYIVHVAYGFASASKRVTVFSAPLVDRLTVSAGALQLAGAIGETPIPPNRLSFSIFVPLGNNSEGRLVTANAKARELIRLPEGTYHVVSTFGESNAIMRSDLKVDSGKITEATLNHRAATVTLKLVGAAGGEAFAGTAFSVLT